MDFIPGLELSESFYFEIIRPLMQKNYPNLRFAAALLGTGSEVQGFDDLTSTDHHWGVRLLLFLENNDFENQKAALKIFFRKNLPFEFRGYSTNWTSPDPNDNNNQFPEHISEGDINHRVEIFTVTGYLFDTLGIDSIDLSDIDWLLLPEQRLREFTQGKVFEDLVGTLTNARNALSYFPHNVWLYKILTQWNKIAEEIPFPGRIGMQKDTFGAQIETSRLIRYAMILCFILEKKYIPYPKWFSKAFYELKLSRSLTPMFQMALNEFNFKKRDEILCEAYLTILQYQNSLGITEPLKLNPKLFFSRPITIIDISKILDSIRILIKPPLNAVKYPIGSIDQIIDYPNLICDSHYFKKLRNLFGEK
ncbi:MAG: DUF4037 domain-containing protein [Promethearchaeota archaeon]|nr:MAG: DUF4037 domain-containing protein [Candidatus Lokiarchaeota archaeon]